MQNQSAKSDPTSYHKKSLNLEAYLANFEFRPMKAGRLRDKIIKFKEKIIL